MAKMAEDTPLIKQFFEVKAQHPEALLLYRVGDFYETYSDDAVTASRVLGLVQTKKSNGDKGPIPMAGFPHHAIGSAPASRSPSATSWRTRSSRRSSSSAG